MVNWAVSKYYFKDCSYCIYACRYCRKVLSWWKYYSSFTYTLWKASLLYS